MTHRTVRPAWWPTPEQKLHADAGCAHPDKCNVKTEPSDLAITAMIEADTLARGYAATGARGLARERAIRVLAEPSDRDKFAGDDLPLFEKLQAVQDRFHAATTVAEHHTAAAEEREIREEFSASMDRRFIAWRYWNDVD